MLKSLLRDRKLIALLVLAIFIKVFSLNEAWVETWYTYGFYPFWSRLERTLLGWIPLSVGDLLYIFSFIFLILKAWKFLRLLAKRKVREYLSWILFRKYLRLVLWIYIIFNLSWGLNYNRLGIAHQLGLSVKAYDREDLVQIATLLQERLNHYAAQTDSIKRLEFNRHSRLTSQARDDYERAAKNYSFLKYRSPSIKTSLLSPLGHLFGFSGYINPFTGEAQMNNKEPVYLKPFVINHEIAHQLGYGKENEASFVSFLVTKESSSIDFRYSLYYELYFDALYEMRVNGELEAQVELRKTLHPRVVIDKMEEQKLRQRNRNVLQPYVTDFYSGYLKMNNQPGGMSTYNEVIAWLIAYVKKYGVENL